MRGVVGFALTFVLAMSLTGIAMERGGRGAHEFDLGPVSAVAGGQVRAVGLDAPGGIRTARRYPRFTAVYMTRTPSGSIAVFPNATPVAGCLLVWRPSTTAATSVFTDPCAGGEWDEQGRYVSGPERQDLLRLLVTVSDAGRLLIDTLDVSSSSPAEIPPEAMPEIPSPPALLTPTYRPEWALVPTVARPPRSEHPWAGALITLGREWGISATDAAVLIGSLGLVAGVVAYGGASLWRARARGEPGVAAVYLEWRSRRVWSRYPEPVLVFAPGDGLAVRVRLRNEGAGVARGVSVLLEARRPLSVDLDTSAGVVTRSVLPEGVQIRWEYKRPLRPGGHSGVETLRVIRSEDAEDADDAGLTSVIVVRCTPGGGGTETTTHVAVEIA